MLFCGIGDQASLRPEASPAWRPDRDVSGAVAMAGSVLHRPYLVTFLPKRLYNAVFAHQMARFSGKPTPAFRGAAYEIRLFA